MPKPPMDATRWQRLSPLLDELQPLPEGERERRLAALAVEAPDDAQALRRLLQAVSAAQDAGFLDGVADDALLAQPLNPGDGVGPWRLLRPVGEGGMGEVWHAQRSDGRHDGLAAVKLLKHGWRDPAMHERFRREGTVLSRLHHPGIAQLLDAGVTPTGQPFLVLEWVDGQRIDHWCDAAGMDIAARLRLFLQVLAAVSAAHNQLVIHRDLKPSNIFVDGQGTVKLLDFGIARLLDDSQVPQITREGALALTAEYAAPEQFAHGAALGVATDVYALGVVLYELLTGQHPSGLATGSPPLAYLQAAQTGPARRASAASRGAADARQLAGDLDTILACALAAEPAQRYPTAQALADDLVRHLEHRPVAARRAGWAERSRKFVRRNRALVAMGAAAGIALSAGVVGTLGMAWRAAQHAEAAEAARALASAEAVEAIRQRDEVMAERDRIREFEEFLDFLMQQAFFGKPWTPVQLLQRAAEHFDRVDGLSDRNRAEVLGVIGGYFLGLDRWSEGEATLRRAISHASRSPDPGVRADQECLLAVVLMNAGKFQEASTTWRAAVERLPATPRHTDSQSFCLHNGAHIEVESGDPLAALETANKAMQIAKSTKDPAEGSLTGALIARAWIEMSAGRFKDAIHDYDTAWKDLKSRGEEAGSTGITTAVNESTLWMYAGRPLDGLAKARLARQMATAGKAGTSAERLPQGFVDLGLEQMEDLPAALHRSDALLKDNQISNNRRIGHRLHLHRITILRKLGRLGDAEALIRATRARVADLPAGNFHFGMLSLEEGLVQAARGNAAGARRQLDDAVAQLRAATNAKPFLPWALIRRGEFLLAQRDTAGAQQDATEALALLSSTLGPDLRSRHKGDAWRLLAQVAARNGDAQAAQAHYQNAATEYADSIGPTHATTRKMAALAGDATPRR